MYTLTEKMRARRRYVLDGLTYAELAKESRISISALKKWGKVQAWKTARDKLLASALAGDSEAVRLQKIQEQNITGLVTSPDHPPTSSIK